ncbi:MAG: parallel beta-helix repeat protein, partial [Candidatus Woesearchaeota archaeon]
TIAANGVSLNGAGYQITYATGGTGYGLDNSGGYDNVVIRNVSIIESGTTTANNYGIYFSGVDDSIITNSSVTTKSRGPSVLLSSSSDRNNITSVYAGNAFERSAHCVSITGGQKNRISKLNCTQANSYSKYGVYITDSYNNVTQSSIKACAGCSAIIVQGFPISIVIDGVNSSGSGNMLWLSQVTDVVVNNSIFGTSGGNSAGLELNSLQDILIQNSYFFSTNNYGAISVAGTNVEFRNVTVDGGSVYGILSQTSISSSNVSFYNVTVKNGSQYGLSLGASASHENWHFYNTTILGTTVGARIRAPVENVSFVGGRISGSTAIQIDGPTGGIFVSNVSIEGPISYVSGSATLYEEYFLDIEIRNTTTVQQDANVTIYNSSSGLVYSGQTDSNGRIVVQNLTHRIINATSTYYSSPYRVNTTHLQWLLSDNISVNMSTNQFKTLNVSNTLTDCRILDRTGGDYVLANDVYSQGTCFTIQADGITLNGGGYTVNYSSTGLGGAGVLSDGYSNITIMNMILTAGNESSFTQNGMNLSNGDNLTVQNVTFTISGGSYGILLTNTDDSVVTNVSMYDNTVNESITGIYLYTSVQRVNITKSYFNISSTGTSYGIYFYQPDSVLIENNTIIVHNSSSSGVLGTQNRINNVIRYNNISAITDSGFDAVGLLFSSADGYTAYGNTFTGDRAITTSDAGLLAATIIYNNTITTNLGILFNGVSSFNSLYHSNKITVLDNTSPFITGTTGGGANHTFYNNTFYGTSIWVSDTSSEGNHYNTTINGRPYGNTWPNITLYEVSDNNYNDGIGDGGYHWPVSNATMGVSMWAGPGADYGPLTTTGFSCGNLTQANKIYNLTQNLSAPTGCFKFFADNITLDGKGYTVNFSIYPDNASVAIYTYGYDNLAIKNINLFGAYPESIYGDSGIDIISSSNVTVSNVSIKLFTRDYHGVYVASGASDIYIYNNTFYMWNPGDNYRPKAFNSYNASSVHFYNNFINISEGREAQAIYMRDISTSYFHNNTVHMDAYNGIALYDGLGGNSNLLIANNTITAYSGGTAMEFLRATSVNITILNNTIYSEKNGVSLLGASNITIKGNTITAPTTINLDYGTVYFNAPGNSTFVDNILNASVLHINVSDYRVHNITFYGNELVGAGMWVNNSNGTNNFNKTVDGVNTGNIYPNASSYQVYDHDLVGYATEGKDYPFNNATLQGLWEGPGADYGPATTRLGCGNYTAAGLYNITENLTHDYTCINVKANKVNVQCGGNKITFGQANNISAGISNNGYDAMNITGCRIAAYNMSTTVNAIVSLNNERVIISNVTLEIEQDTSVSTQVLLLSSSNNTLINKTRIVFSGVSSNGTGYNIEASNVNITNSNVSTPNNAQGLRIAGNDVIINKTNISISSIGSTQSVYVQSANNTIIQNSIIRGGDYSITHLGSDDLFIDTNNLTGAIRGGNGAGEYTRIINNRINTGSQTSVGSIYWQYNDGEHAQIIGNTIIEDIAGMGGISLRYSNGNVLWNFTIANNTINGNPIIFNKSITGGTVIKNPVAKYGQVICYSCNNTILQNLTITSGLEIYSSDRIQVNNISVNASADHAVEVYGVENSTFYNITARLDENGGIEYALSVDSSSRNNFSNISLIASGYQAYGLSTLLVDDSSFTNVDSTADLSTSGRAYNLAFTYDSNFTNAELSVLTLSHINILMNNVGNLTFENLTLNLWAFNGSGIDFNSNTKQVNITNVTIDTTGAGGTVFVLSSSADSGNITIKDTNLVLGGANEIALSSPGQTFRFVNTTTNTSLFSATTTANVEIYSYLDANFSNTSNQNVSGITLQILNQTNETYITYTLPSNSTMRNKYVLHQTLNGSQVVNYSDYRIQVDQPLFYLDDYVSVTDNVYRAFIVNKSIADVEYVYANKTVPNYNYLNTYVFTEDLNFSVYNGTIKDINITFVETQANDFLASYDRVDGCSDNILAETNCSLQVNISLNSGLGLSSLFAFTVNYTNPDGTNSSILLPYSINILEFANASSNITSITYNAELSDLNRTGIRVSNTGSTTTNLLTVNTTHDFFIIRDNNLLIDSTYTSLTPGGYFDMFADLRITNYTAANYSGNITVSSSKLNLTIPYTVNVTPQLTIADKSVSVQHNTTSALTFQYNNTGNVKQDTIAWSYVAGTLNSSFVEYKSSLTSEMNFTRSNNASVNVSIPTHYTSGTYSGTFVLTTDSGYTRNILLSVTVPTNRSWKTTPAREGIEHSISDSILTENSLPNITITNYGNVDINVTVTPLYTGYGDEPFTPVNRYTAVSGQATPFIVQITKNDTYTVEQEIKAFVVSETKTNMGLGFNLTIVNTTNAQNTSITSIFLINVTDSLPEVTGWRLGAYAATNEEAIELNKAYNFSASASDDSNNLNVTAAYFSITNSVNTTNYSYDAENNLRYTFQFTPTVGGQHNISLFVSENVTVGGKVGNGSIVFNVSSSPTSVIISATAVSTNQSNQTNDANVTVPFTMRVNGDVQIYDVNFSVESLFSPAWDSVNTTTSYITNNTNTDFNIIITVPNGTSTGDYTLQILAVYRLPNGTVTNQTGNFTLTVEKNHAFRFSTNQSIAQTDGSQGLYTVTITPRGNAQTNMTLEATGSTHTISFFRGGPGYTNPSSGHSLVTSSTTAVIMRITTTSGSNATETFNITATNSFGEQMVFPVTLSIPSDLSTSISTTNYTQNVVASTAYTKNIINITNDGNSQILVNFTLSGDVSNFAGSGGSGMTIVSSANITPSKVYSLNATYTMPPGTSTYEGNLTINVTGGDNYTVPLTVTSYTVTLSAFNFSNFGGVDVGETIAVNASFVVGGIFIGENVTFVPKVNGIACGSVSTSTFLISTDTNYLIACTAPSLTDGASYTFTLDATYTADHIGIISVNSSDTGTVVYNDVTAGAVSDFAINDTFFNVPSFMETNITDNIAITDSNSNSYTITLETTHVATSTRVSHVFARVLGQAGTFRKTSTFTQLGDHSYILRVLDPSSNRNSSYTGSFVVYEYKTFNSTLNFTNSSAQITAVDLNVTLSSTARSYNVTITNGTLNRTVTTGLYEMQLRGYTSNITFDNINLERLPTYEMFDYGQLRLDDAVVIAQSLFTGIAPNEVFNAVYTRLNDTPDFEIWYNYTSYAVTQENNLHAYACYNYTIDGEALDACQGGWFGLDRSYISTSKNIIILDSPKAITANETVAIIFLQFNIVGDPRVTFSQNSITDSLNHSETIQVPLTISSATVLGQGGTLTDISVGCYTGGSDASFCSTFTISNHTISSIVAGTSEQVTINLTAPSGTTPGTYSGTIRYASNAADQTPLARDIAVSLTVISDSTITFNNTADYTTTTGARSEVVIDTINFTNNGNALVTPTFTFSGVLLSNSSVNVTSSSNQSYDVQLLAPTQNGIYVYQLNVSEINKSFNYTLTVNQRLTLVNITTNTNVAAGDTLTTYFRVYDRISDSDIENTSSSVYFDNYTVTIDNITCVSSIGSVTISSSDPDSFTCTAPNMTRDLDTYNFELIIFRSNIETRDNYTVTYGDVLAPTVSGVTSTIEYQNVSNITFTLADRNSLATNITVSVINSTGTVVNSTLGFVSDNSTNSIIGGLYNTSSSSFVFRYNFSVGDDYTVTITFCDDGANCANLTTIVSHFRLTSFQSNYGTPSRGLGSSIISSQVRTTSSTSGQGGVVLSTPRQTNIFLKKPGTSRVLFQGTTGTSDSKFNFTRIQERKYDVQIVNSEFTLNLTNVTYNGSEIIAFEKLNVDSITNARLGFGFESTINYTGSLQYAVAKSGVRSTAYFVVCTSLDYTAPDSCDGTQTSETPIRRTSNATHYLFTLNITHFSSYTLIVPTATTTPTTSSGSSGSSSGGGGGASLGSISELLDEKVGNLSSVGLGIDEISVDTTNIDQTLFPSETAVVFIDLANTGNASRQINVTLTPELPELITLTPTQTEIKRGSSTALRVDIAIPEDAIPQTYDGFIQVKYSGGKLLTIPVKIRVVSKPGKLSTIDTRMLTPRLLPSGTVRMQVDIEYGHAEQSNATIRYDIITDGENLVYSDSESFILSESLTKSFAFELDEQFSTGLYNFLTTLSYVDPNGQYVELKSSNPITITENILYKELFTVFGYAFRVLDLIYIIILSCLITYGLMYLRTYIENKKRYHLPVSFNLLPSPGPSSGYLGYLAETNIRSFVELEQMKTHTLVAGSTGGGKSFAAQVIVEEALKKNVSVVVFDPTAQWTGFLRKNQSQALLKLFKKYGMDPKTDPTGFKGNIRRVENPLEIIKLEEYLKPGEITVFDLHKLSFEQIDLFVANTVSQVFMSELDESSDLKLLMVYDEVHRLLPKFGGSGAGFMQIERGCREFRKWGIGLLLISQVLSDFIGKIKANINTEIQMRTRDDEDLKRLSMKYGEDLLHAVVKAEVGTGMIQNSKYNKGRPYLVSFKPVMHAPERLGEKELDEYFVYNKKLLNLYDSVKQLEVFKVDVMDLRIELDLAYDKLKEAKFDVVEIYLDGVSRTIEKKWSKLKKKPKTRTVELLDKKTVNKFIELAKRQHYEGAKETKKEEMHMPVIDVESPRKKEKETPVLGIRETAKEKEPTTKEQKKKSMSAKQSKSNKFKKLRKLLDE